MKEKDLIRKWLDNALTDEELKAFKKLDAYDSYIKISDTSKKILPPSYDVTEELNEIQQHISQRTVSKNKSYLGILLRIAAVFVLGLGVYTFFANQDTKINTLAGQKVNIELPDQTKVQLNALSEVIYNKKDWDNNREVHLEGEAYFKVAKGKKFDVLTPLGVVTVLGTEFNVKQRKGYFEVICYEGLVSVSYQQNTYRLPPGKGIELLSKKINEINTVDTNPSWIENKSIFKSKPYYLVLGELERQYDVVISSKNIDQHLLFTGNFVHSDIQMALESITIPMGLKYEINENQVTLYKQ